MNTPSALTLVSLLLVSSLSLGYAVDSGNHNKVSQVHQDAQTTAKRNYENGLKAVHFSSSEINGDEEHDLVAINTKPKAKKKGSEKDELHGRRSGTGTDTSDDDEGAGDSSSDSGDDSDAEPETIPDTTAAPAVPEPSESNTTNTTDSGDGDNSTDTGLSGWQSGTDTSDDDEGAGDSSSDSGDDSDAEPETIPDMMAAPAVPEPSESNTTNTTNSGDGDNSTDTGLSRRRSGTNTSDDDGDTLSSASDSEDAFSSSSSHSISRLSVIVGSILGVAFVALGGFMVYRLRKGSRQAAASVRGSEGPSVATAIPVGHGRRERSSVNDKDPAEARVRPDHIVVDIKPL